MVTVFSALLSLSGMSQTEAAKFLGVSASSVDKMSRGVRRAPDAVTAKMASLIRMQDEGAKAALHDRRWNYPSDGNITPPENDEAAGNLGYPTVSAWVAMAARVIAARIAD